MSSGFSFGPLVFVVALASLLVGAVLLSRRRTIVKRVPARLESIRPLMQTFGEFASEVRLGDQAIYQCQLAIDEACTNIIRHAYNHDSTGEIEVMFKMAGDGCTISLTDFGEPYDPTNVPRPQKGQDLENAQPGGLGLYLMHTLMDEVRYTPGLQGNRLVMVKRRR
jgi:serine/threonine-protein kinase RsbW